MTRYRFPKLGTLTVEETDRTDRDGRTQWEVTFRRYRARKPCLAFEIGQPLIGLFGETERETEAKIASSAISFMSEPSAWDDVNDREVCEDIGEELSMRASSRMDTLGRIVRREGGY